jgi:hypothetical protein
VGQRQWAPSREIIWSVRIKLLNRAARRDEPIASHREVRWPKSPWLKRVADAGGVLAGTIGKRTQAKTAEVSKGTRCVARRRVRHRLGAVEHVEGF